MRNHTSRALVELEWRLKVFSRTSNLWFLNFTTPRYTLLFLYSEIYIEHVINNKWSRFVIFRLYICIFPSALGSTGWLRWGSVGVVGLRVCVKGYEVGCVLEFVVLKEPLVGLWKVVPGSDNTLTVGPSYVCIYKNAIITQFL